MTIKISSIGLKGLEGYRVQVQVSEGKESMVIVVLPDTSVKEYEGESTICFTFIKV